MTDPYADIPLYPLINPRSIAFFGASNRYSAMGTNQLNSVQDLGFKGEIYPIHPTEETVLGIQAYKDVMDLPEVPDLAVIVLPTKIVAQTLKACGEKGIKHAIVVSAGFKEMGGEGVAKEEELVEIARQYDIKFIGPNCLGVVNPHHRFNVTFASFEGKPGFIGLASQSGSLLTQMFGVLEGFNIGFSTGISVGNEAVVDIVDCMEYLSACPHTKVIGLYIETIRRGPKFIETARRIAPNKPIVAYYPGGSEAGRKAAFSHTGALAGPDELYNGIFRQSGVIRADTLTELFDFCWVLGQYPASKGRNVIVQTHSGGPGAAAADACSRNGLCLPGFSAETLKNLRPLIPHTGSMNNPVDLTFSKDPTVFFRNIPEVLLQEPRADALLLYSFSPQKAIKRLMKSQGASEEEILEFARALAEDIASKLKSLADAHAKPVIGFSYQTWDMPVVRAALKHGIPIMPSPERGARAIFALAEYGEILNRFKVHN